jgi:hypothetical protein
MFTIYVPSISPEIDWICEVIFSEFFGLQYSLKETENQKIIIEKDGKKIILNCDFFLEIEDNWLTNNSLPNLPINHWELPKANSRMFGDLISLPVLYGNPGIEFDENLINIDVDIFGSAFFMLSCYEEAVIKDRDYHGRFPASLSTPYKENFLTRPIVNEYLEFLWNAIDYLWPKVNRKRKTYKTVVTCDVDRPYLLKPKTLFHLGKQFSGDLIKRRSINAGFKTFREYKNYKIGNYNNDSYYSAFNWLMNTNEKYGNKITFHFIVDHSSTNNCGYYDINEPVIKGLMKAINDRGHKIALHGSYNTYKDKTQITKEVEILKSLCDKENINLSLIGNRQHYLRWDSILTPNILDHAGIDYDSTLTYADSAGFKTGVCYEYPMYDLNNKKKLKLKQYPLTVMECTIIDEQYMNCGLTEEGLYKFDKLKSQCKKYNGEFRLLWHNSELITNSQKEFYKSLVKN